MPSLDPRQLARMLSRNPMLAARSSGLPNPADVLGAIPQFTDIPGMDALATSPGLLELLGGPQVLSDDQKRMLTNTVVESAIPFGAVARGGRVATGLRALGRATGDRGVQGGQVGRIASMLAETADAPLAPRPPRFRGIGRDHGQVQLIDKYRDEPNLFNPLRPSGKRTMPQEEYDDLMLGMAHDDPTVIDDLLQRPGGTGLGVPKLGISAGEDDRLARMLMEELGGNAANPSLQAVGAGAAVAGSAFSVQRAQNKELVRAQAENARVGVKRPPHGAPRDDSVARMLRARNSIYMGGR